MRGKEKDACILMGSKRGHDLGSTWMLGGHQFSISVRLKREFNISWQSSRGQPELPSTSPLRLCFKTTWSDLAQHSKLHPKYQQDIFAGFAIPCSSRPMIWPMSSIAGAGGELLEGSRFIVTRRKEAAIEPRGSRVTVEQVAQLVMLH